MALYDSLFFKKKKHLPDILIWKTSLTHAAKKCLGIRARLNRTNIDQHCWSNNVAQCWMRILNKVKADQTYSNMAFKRIQHVASNKVVGLV